MVNLRLLKELLLDQCKDFKNFPLGIERENLKSFETVLKAPHAVVISGLRRAGKSTLLAQISQKYYEEKDYAYVNFEDDRLLSFDASDFHLLLDMIAELFGPKKVYFFDEIQNIPHWEIAIRRLIAEGKKIFITGSNASLLSREFGTKLTGRYLPFELFPFSFREYLQFINLSVEDFRGGLRTEQKQHLRKSFEQYLEKGGIPQALLFPELKIHKILYDDVLYRDIVSRYDVTAVKELRELTAFLLANVGNPISYNKLKSQLMLGSVNTVKSFVEYLESAWLFFVISVFDSSVKRQQIASKKVYGIDTGLIQSLSFRMSENRGRMLENIVFLELKRRSWQVYYWTSPEGFEVDFYVKEKNLFIQVCSDLSDKKTRERELRALLLAKKQFPKASLLLLLDHEIEEIVYEGEKITVQPVAEWLLCEP